MTLNVMPTVIFFDREDVLNFNGVISEAKALTLSPSTLVAAQQAGLSVGDGAPLMTDYGHARCAAAARCALREFDRAAASAQLPDAIIMMARQSVWGHASLVQRLRCSLPDAPLVVRDGNGQWIEAADLQTLYSVLLPRIWDYGLAHHIELAQPNYPICFKYLNRLVAFLERRTSRSWVATSHKLKCGLSDALVSGGATMAIFQPTSGGWGDYAAILRSLFKGGVFRSFRVAPLSTNSPSVVSVLGLLRKLGQAFSDPQIQLAWKLYEPYFARMVPAMLAMTAESSKILSILQPRSVVSFEANSWPAASLMEAAGNSGIKRVVFNHNSQSTCGSPIADSVLDVLFSQRTYNTLIDIAALWSPSVERIPQATLVDRMRVQILPVRLDYPIAHATTGFKRTLRILHAGNYQNWSDFFPWIAETADEYLNGVEALAAKVEQLDGIELVVRVRPKREVDATAVEARLGKRRNVRVCGTEQDFLEQLAESDLLVAHFSTTIEQALQMGKPVLLWGSAHRYQQFAGQEIPPGDALDDAVYVARDIKKLEAMLIGIRDADRKPADYAQRNNKYTFSPSTPGLDALVAYLINPSTKSEAVSQ